MRPRRRRRATAGAQRGQGRLHVETDVVPESAHRQSRPRQAVAIVGGTGSGEHGNTVVAPEESRRQVPHVTVDEALAVEVVGDGAPPSTSSCSTPRRPSSSSTAPMSPSSRAGSAGAWRHVAEHDAQRLVLRLGGPVRARELGVVRRTVPAPTSMASLSAAGDERRPRLRAGYPPARAVRRRRAPVESGGKLEHDIGPPRPAVHEVGMERVLHLLREQTLGDSHTSGLGPDAAPATC